MAAASGNTGGSTGRAGKGKTSAAKSRRKKAYEWQLEDLPF